MRAGTPLLLTLALACASKETPPPDAVELEICPSPRPEMCTREYRPACGHRCADPPCARAFRRTYGNACDACTDPAVNAVEPGVCEEEPPETPPRLP